MRFEQLRVWQQRTNSREGAVHIVTRGTSQGLLAVLVQSQCNTHVRTAARVGYNMQSSAD